MGLRWPAMTEEAPRSDSLRDGRNGSPRGQGTVHDERDHNEEDAVQARPALTPRAPTAIYLCFRHEITLVKRSLSSSRTLFAVNDLSSV
jgi:hypothetical protein